MGDADLVVDAQLCPERAVSRIRAGLLHPATLGLGRDGCAGFCVGRRFVVWRIGHSAGTPEARVLPRPALVGRVDASQSGCRVSARFRAPAPDIVLVAPLALFSFIVLGVFGLLGITGVAVVVIGWGIPARIIAARFLEGDAPVLERWLRTSIANPG